MPGVQEIEAAALDALMAQGAVVIDVRTPAEVARGGIAGARHVPLHLLPLSEGDFIPLRDQPLVFYCQSGARSAQACGFMLSRGYEHVYNLRGGFMGWIRQGLPAASIPARS